MEEKDVKDIKVSNTDAGYLKIQNGTISMLPIPYYVNLCYFICLDFFHLLVCILF